MTFLHTADWQVGRPFAGIDNDLKRSLVQQERIAVITRIGAVAFELGVVFIVVAGDVINPPGMTTAPKSTVSAAGSKISALKIHVLAIPGIHDDADEPTVPVTRSVLRRWFGCHA